MTSPHSHSQQPTAEEAPEAELPQAPPGVPEGHDARPPAGDSAGDAAAATNPDFDQDRDLADPDRDPDPAPEPVEAGAGSAAGSGASTEPAEAYAVAGEELDALTARADRADEYLNLAQRTQADFDNYRKRAIREAAAAQERGAVKLAMALLPAVDNLERALAHAPGPDPERPDEGGFVAGIKHVHSDVVTALAKAGIERYSPEGEPFDPTLHEAVAQQPIEGAQPGTVVEVFQQGYRIGETVVRPARVVVAG